MQSETSKETRSSDWGGYVSTWRLVSEETSLSCQWESPDGNRHRTGIRASEAVRTGCTKPQRLLHGDVVPGVVSSARTLAGEATNPGGAPQRHLGGGAPARQGQERSAAGAGAPGPGLCCLCSCPVSLAFYRPIFLRWDRISTFYSSFRPHIPQSLNEK